MVAAHVLDQPGQSEARQMLNELFRINRRAIKAYLLKDRLWTYTYQGAALRYLSAWAGQLRCQRLDSFNRLADMLFRHLEGWLNYCRVNVPLRRRRSGQRQSQSSSTQRPRVQRPPLPAAEGAADGCTQDRIPRYAQSRVERPILQILAQSHFLCIPESSVSEYPHYNERLAK